MADGCWNAQAESLLSLLVLLFRRPGRESTSSIFVQVELASRILEGKKGHQLDSCARCVTGSITFLFSLKRKCFVRPGLPSMVEQPLIEEEGNIF